MTTSSTTEQFAARVGLKGLSHFPQTTKTQSSPPWVTSSTASKSETPTN